MAVIDAKPEQEALQPIPASTWEGREVVKQEWLVDGMIPMLTTTSLAGDGGLGKSLLAMQLMTCCGSGKRFLNRDTKQALSVGLFCEDRENQLHERQDKINEHYQIGYKDIVDVNYLPRVGSDNALITSTHDKPQATDFFRQFRQCVLDLGAKLVVIDTAADTFMGNENIRTQVRYYVQLLNGLANDTQGAVLLLIHPSLTGLSTGTGTSGSTAWNNSVRSRWYLEKDQVSEHDESDPNIRILSQKKSNYSAVDSTGTRLIWENGVFKLKLEDSGLMRKLEINAIAKECLHVIEHYHTLSVNLSIYPNVKNYGPRLIKEKITGKTTFKDVQTAFNQLLDQGKIINKQYGPPSHEKYRIEISPAPPAPALNGPLQHTEEEQYTIL